MASTGFTFPPPPPPPPKTNPLPGTSFNNQFQGHRGGSIYRGGDRGAGRGRGRGFGGRATRGFSVPRGRGQGPSFVAPASPNNSFANHSEILQNHSQRGDLARSDSLPQSNQWDRWQNPTSSKSMLDLNPPHKRDHSTAFSQRGRGGAKPLAAPAVPSFLANIDGLAPPEVSKTHHNTRKDIPEKNNKSKTTNILGLNPSLRDQESEEDDEDEEAKLATGTDVAQGGVVFEYHEKLSTLKTPAEIAAWIAERRKNFPTAAKAAEAKRAATEKKQKWEEEMRAKQEARRLEKKKLEEEKRLSLEKKRLQVEAQSSEKERSKSKVETWMEIGEPVGRDKAANAAEKARLKAEKLLKKAEKTQRQLKKAQEKLQKMQDANAAITSSKRELGDRNEHTAESMNHLSTSTLEDVASTISSVLSSSESEDEETSSSGSSSSSSTSEGPEIQSIRSTGPLRVSAPPRRGHALPIKIPANTCRNMVKFGLCRNQKKCSYSHTNPAEGVGVVGKWSNGDRNKKQKQGDVGVSRVTGRSKRKSLYEVMVQKEKEEEARIVLGAIVDFGQKGLLKKSDAGE